MKDFISIQRQTCWRIIPRIFAVNKEEEHNQMRRRSVGVASKATKELKKN
jgi:hypothetical protein